VSETIVQLIPDDPEWVGDPVWDADLIDAVTGMAPRAADVVVERYDDIVFVDAGANFERVRCPHCRADLSIDWWHDRMDDAHAGHFQDRAVVTPCCARPSDLADLTYDWPQGFARWALVIRDPRREKLTPIELSHLATLATHPLRQIVSRY
jgi:hypothetical protein